MPALNLINIHYYPYQFGIDFFGLLGFSLGSFVLISMLILYYNRIPKSTNSKSKLDNPIYQTKDILLQSNSNDANFIITQKTASTWSKVLVFILIVLFVIIPVDQLFSLVNRFY